MQSPPVAVGDYAACIGTTGYDYDAILSDGSTIPTNGTFPAVRGVRFGEITDGLSNTLLVGEKHVPRGSEGGYPWDCGIYDGHNPVCSLRAAGPDFPLASSPNDTAWVFGSHHPGICQFVFGDGSVRSLANTTDSFLLGLLANRADGQLIPDF